MPVCLLMLFCLACNTVPENWHACVQCRSYLLTFGKGVQLISGWPYAEAEQLSQLPVLSGVIPVTQFMLERGFARIQLQRASIFSNFPSHSGIFVFTAPMGSPAFPANDSHFGCYRFTNVTPHVLRMPGANLPSTFDVISLFGRGGANVRIGLGLTMQDSASTSFLAYTTEALHIYKQKCGRGKTPLRVNIFISLYA